MNEAFIDPSPEEIAMLEAAWFQIWHQRFQHLSTPEYMIFKVLILEAVYYGMTQEKNRIIYSLNKSLDQPL